MDGPCRSDLTPNPSLRWTATLQTRKAAEVRISGTPRRTGMADNHNPFDGEEVALLAAEVFSGHESLPAERCLQIHRLMVRSRIMEERMIRMSKSGQGYFWIGGPGEEAFNTCLGLQVHKGQGP